MASNVYEDDRYVANEEEKGNALTDNEQMYDGMIADTKEFYEGQMAEVDKIAKEQADNQQEQTDFAIEKIEQQKQQAQEDYTKEQKGSYVDWQKQSNAYGAQAEQMASQGLAQTGFSESSQVSMWNTYQNRIATARESLKRAEIEYDNMMKDAILQNSSALAEIAANAFAQKAALALEGFKYSNDLLTQKADREMQIQSMYESRGQSIIDQINYEEQMRYQQDQDRIANERYERELSMQEEQWKVEKEMYGIGYDDDENIVFDQVTNSKYWNGERAENVGGFGYFKNGYQPKGIWVIHNGQKVPMKLSKYNGGTKAGDIFGKDFANSSGVNVANQNIWTAGGKYFIWNGSKNKYEEVVLPK